MLTDYFNILTPQGLINEYDLYLILGFIYLGGWQGSGSLKRYKNNYSILFEDDKERLLLFLEIKIGATRESNKIKLHKINHDAP